MNKAYAIAATAVALCLSMPAYADDAASGSMEGQVLQDGAAATEEGATGQAEMGADVEAGASGDTDLLEDETAETGGEGELDAPEISEDQPGVIGGEDIEDDEPGAGAGSTDGGGTSN